MLSMPLSVHVKCHLNQILLIVLITNFSQQSDKNGMFLQRDKMPLQVLHFGFTTIAQLTSTTMVHSTDHIQPGHPKLTIT
jgi:hypothetical protein